MGTARVCVLGSANMDLVVFADRAPSMGETVTGDRFVTIPGGKGANQAIAAARAGGEVHMVGAVGRDAVRRPGAVGAAGGRCRRRPDWPGSRRRPGPRTFWSSGTATTRSLWFPAPTARCTARSPGLAAALDRAADPAAPARAPARRGGRGRPGSTAPRCQGRVDARAGAAAAGRAVGSGRPAGAQRARGGGPHRPERRGAGRDRTTRRRTRRGGDPRCTRGSVASAGPEAGVGTGAGRRRPRQHCGRRHVRGCAGGRTGRGTADARGAGWATAAAGLSVQKEGASTSMPHRAAIDEATSAR